MEKTIPDKPLIYPVSKEFADMIIKDLLFRLAFPLMNRDFTFRLDDGIHKLYIDFPKLYISYQNFETPETPIEDLPFETKIEALEFLSKHIEEKLEECKNAKH